MEEIGEGFDDSEFMSNPQFKSFESTDDGASFKELD